MTNFLDDCLMDRDRLGISIGRQAYEEDVRRRSNYPDGSPRKAWDKLGEVERWSWERK